MKALKLLGLITGIAILDIVALSPGLLGVEIGGESAVETASGVTLLFCSLLALLYGSYNVLLKPPVATPVKSLKTREDYITALSSYRKVKTLTKEISLGLDQLDRMEKKTITLSDVLSQRFDLTELSFRKFIHVINEVEKLFYLNIRGILNKLSVFDASEFSVIGSPQRHSQSDSPLFLEKTNLYREYLDHLIGYLDANEEILLKLDRLLLEISRLGNANYEDIAKMPCMIEIDSLIKQTKFYQQ
ncbi:hypothetical protein [Cohnella lupini]|uniref:Uncharacterized protein n=1 Tax=Cohnella lupini TaxID=1294267 RepID=A0A3D9ICI5_9BACL|nr:hypothetical protein DFP95_10798 [Cohnella lupini]